MLLNTFLKKREPPKIPKYPKEVKIENPFVLYQELKKELSEVMALRAFKIFAGIAKEQHYSHLINQKR